MPLQAAVRPIFERELQGDMIGSELPGSECHQSGKRLRANNIVQEFGARFFKRFRYIHVDR